MGDSDGRMGRPSYQRNPIINKKVMTSKDNLNNHIHQMDETSCPMDEVYDHQDAIDIINQYLLNKYVVEFVG
jgi:hypothetical protein